VASGILNLNKPRGMTSFAVVALVRRLTGVRRVGHAGTLDPIAEGVLPVCLGPATRVVEYLVAQPKLYAATLKLGEATDTYDSEGAVVATGDPSGVSQEQIEALLPQFIGEIRQLPPMYSALKYQGQPLYRYARAGREAPREERTVAVYRLELRRFRPPRLELEMEVGRGAYVRTLAHDLGERLGCHAHLEALTRLRTGPFTVAEALSLEQFRSLVEEGIWEESLHGPDRVLERWYAALLDEEHSLAVCQGRAQALRPASPAYAHLPIDTLCRAYSYDGRFLAVLRSQGGNLWRPEKVFASP
jgi:tRNA pseudouridine55 synthase